MKISVALCTYNGEKYIAEQLQSILDQTRLPDEIIICDDNSSDRTLDITKDVLEKNVFRNYKIEINNPPKKTIKNFEKAIMMCTGDWIFLSDQDDVWDKNKVEKLLGCIRKKTLLLFTNGHLIDESGNKIHSTLWDKWDFTVQQRERWINNKLAFQDLLQNRNYVTGATVLLSRKLLKQAIPITVPDGHYHDAWFAMHAAAKNGLHFLDDSTISYRIHPQQQVGISKSGKNTESVFSSENIPVHVFRDKILRQYRINWFQKKKNTLKKIIKHLLKR